MRWEVSLPAVACDAGEEFITRIFAPLGYEVDGGAPAARSAFPAWGESDLYTVRLSGAQTVQAVLSHLYVLLPVLDNTKHYYVEARRDGEAAAPRRRSGWRRTRSAS